MHRHDSGMEIRNAFVLCSYKKYFISLHSDVDDNLVMISVIGDID